MNAEETKDNRRRIIQPTPVGPNSTAMNIQGSSQSRRSISNPGIDWGEESSKRGSSFKDNRKSFGFNTHSVKEESKRSDNIHDM